MTLAQEFLALLSGILVGFSLGLIGGGGSILAVPLLLYVVGIPDPHKAIGTSALAVAVNAVLNLIPHARRGNVLWRPALTFALCGAAGAAIGSSAGKLYDGQRLLVLFALLMLAIAALMLRPKPKSSGNTRDFTPATIGRLLVVGTSAGLLAGFFGIGGGFLIVPGLILATAMPMLNAVGSSLVAVGAFGATTALNYAWSGLVDWPLAALFITGGIGGGWIGAAAAQRIALKRELLTRIFATVIIFVAAYMLIATLRRLFA